MWVYSSKIVLTEATESRWVQNQIFALWPESRNLNHHKPMSQKLIMREKDQMRCIVTVERQK